MTVSPVQGRGQFFLENSARQIYVHKSRTFTNCIRSICDTLGFYADIQIFIGTVYSCYIYWDSVAAIYVGPTDCSDGGALRQLVLSSSTKICFAIFHSIFYIRVHCLYYSIYTVCIILYTHTLSVLFYIYTVCIVEICENSKQHRISFSCETPHTPYTCVYCVAVCVCVCVCVCECYDPVVDFYG